MACTLTVITSLANEYTTKTNGYTRTTMICTGMGIKLGSNYSVYYAINMTIIQTRNRAKNSIIIGLPTRIVVIIFRNIAKVVE